ncbi:MAG: hypothetical protein WCL60_01310 [Methylococcales bacterium]
MKNKSYSFASLLGISSKKTEENDDQASKDLKNWQKKAEEDDRYERAEDESDDDYAKRCKALDSEEDQEEEEGEEEEKDDKKAKKAEKEEDDDKAKKAVKAERQRCARIIAHGIKTSNIEQAGVFAFDTDMPASAAISALNAAGSVSARKPKSALFDAMNARKDPNITSDSEGSETHAPGSDAAKAAEIVKAYNVSIGKTA